MSLVDFDALASRHLAHRDGSRTEVAPADLLPVAFLTQGRARSTPSDTSRFFFEPVTD